MAENVLLTIQGDIRDIKSKFAQVEKTVKKISGTTQKQTNAMSSRFQNLGGIVKTVFAAAAIYKFTQGLKATAIAASNLEEQTAKFGTVFRGSLDEANKSVEDLTENYAMSTREARQNMAAIQDLLVPMGMARDKATGFSGEIVKLSADLGSFNNLPTAQVMDNIASALTGQYRAVRKYGVVLLDQQVRQRAVNDGLADSTEEVTALQKALTAYRMMLEQTADAQGDMARTADSFANTMKRFNAQIEDFKASIGQYIIPALSWWAEKLSVVIGYFDDLIQKSTEAPQGRTMIETLKMQIVDLRMEVETYQKIVESGRSSTERAVATRKLAEATEELAWAQEKLNKLLKAEKDVIYDIDANRPSDAPKGALLPPVFKPEPYITPFKSYLAEIKTIEPEIRIINEEMSIWEQNAYQVGGALAGTFTQIIGGASSAEEAIRKLAFQMAALAATSFIPGGWGQFIGGFLGMLGAPAPAPIRQPKPKPAVRTVGQERQNITYSTPMYGRRFVKEMNRSAINVDSISAWSLG